MELVNKIDEKELFAARSTADAAGNNIADTYAKKTEIPDVSDFVTQQELSTELNTKQDNLSTEQLYNIDNAVTSLAGVMAESKLTIEGGKITEYDGTPFAGGSSDIVHFDYNNGNPELSWSEITAYMDIGKQIIIYDRTVATDGKTKLGYVSNYDNVNNFIQFTNISNMVVEGETVNGINWAYVGNSLGWQRTFIRNGGSGGKTYTGVDPIIVDNDANTISANTIDVDYQQITHDDSLVHVSNDAQYALGVNTTWLDEYISQSGHGSDETILWNDIEYIYPNRVLQLTESAWNFEYLKFSLQRVTCNEVLIKLSENDVYGRRIWVFLPCGRDNANYTYTFELDNTGTRLTVGNIFAEFISEYGERSYDYNPDDMAEFPLLLKGVNRKVGGN